MAIYLKTLCNNGRSYTLKSRILLHHPATTFSSYYNKKEQTSQNENSNKDPFRRYAATVAVALSALGLYFFHALDVQKIYAFGKHKKVEYGAPRADLKTYTMEEIGKHDNKKTGIWIIYKHGVYNITDFVEKHPGGPDKIMMAAGASIEPFWSIFANHNKDDILSLLESMRIGNVSESDATSHSADDNDPYSNEPQRHKALKINGQKPFCAEPPASLLVESFYTPTELFYVRNHLPVPEIDLKTYELELAVEEKTQKILKLDDIKKYPKYTVTSAVMCAGNRRSEMAKAKPLKGLSWSVGAVGNASWSGARLCDVLNDLGIKEDDYNHVQFEGLDLDPSGTYYGASIPISRALDPRADVLLAYEMNGQPISRDHGFPIRAIVPGVVGARNVKWLGKIIISKEESPSQWQQRDYKGFSPSTDWDNVDFSKSPAIQELPVISAICSPEPMDKVPVKDHKISVKGYAWSGGGKKIIRIDVTADEGNTWHTANIVAQDSAAKEGRHWGWTIWNIELPVDPKVKHAEIWVKAVDSAYNVQPESFKNIWNLRGFLCNAYHRLKVELIQ